MHCHLSGLVQAEAEAKGENRAFPSSNTRMSSPSCPFGLEMSEASRTRTAGSLSQPPLECRSYFSEGIWQ